MSKKTTKRTGDLAHAPGHRRLNIEGIHESGKAKVMPQDESALNRMADSERIFRNENPHRRVIPGAAIERKGRRG